MRSSRASNACVALDRALVAAEGHVDVAKRFERPQRAGIDVGGAPEIAQRGFELVLRLVDGAALEVRQHRVRLARDRAAVGLDGLERPFGHDGRVAVGNQAVEFALVGQGAKGQGAGHAGNGDDHDG